MTKERALAKAQLYREWASKAEKKSHTLYDSFYSVYGDFLSLGEPVKIGHHSQRKHERLFEKQDNVMRTCIELDAKAKRFLEKANNLEQFANTNKGDAERKRQAVRDTNDEKIKVGSLVVDWCFGQGEVLKVNTKTYTIRFSPDFKCTRDKSYIK